MNKIMKHMVYNYSPDPDNHNLNTCSMFMTRQCVLLERVTGGFLKVHYNTEITSAAFMLVWGLCKPILVSPCAGQECSACTGRSF